MIYFIGRKDRIIGEHPRIAFKDIDEAVDEILLYDLICEDTETIGLDYTVKNPLKLIQLGTPEHQYVFNVKDIDTNKLKPILESKRIEKICANIYFEFAMLQSIDINIRNTFDVLLGARIIRQGREERYLSVNGQRAYIYSLAGIYKEYLDIDMDKEHQSSFIGRSETYTVAQILYAAKDVEIYDIYADIVRRMVKYELIEEDYNLTVPILELAEAGRLSVGVLEQKVSLYFSAMLYNGIKLDDKGLIVLYNENMLKRKDIERELNKMVIDKYPEYRGYIVEPLQNDTFTQYSLFGEPITNREKKKKIHRINWGSHIQVKNIIFQEVGETITDKYGKKTTDIKILSKPKYSKHPLVKQYIKLAKLSKLISSYGEKYLKNININTGRIHYQITQVLETGRVAPKKPNLAQVPKENKWRKLFIAERDNKIVGADYKAQESQVMADKSGDVAFIDFFQNGDGDSHSMVASKVFSVKERREINVKKFRLAVEHKGDLIQAFKDRWKQEYPDAPKTTSDEKYFIMYDDNEDENERVECPLRMQGKVLNFFISFGGSAYTLSDSQDIPMDEAEELLDGFWRGFPELKLYFDAEKKFAIDKGYIITNSITKRRRWLPQWKDYRELENRKEEKKKSLVREFGYQKGARMFYAKFKQKESDVYQLNRSALRLKGDMERQAMNQGIQGTAADMTKAAECLLQEKIEARGLSLIKEIMPINHIHDEISTEAWKRYAKLAAELIQESMESSSLIFNNVLKIRATPYISNYWQH